MSGYQTLPMTGAGALTVGGLVFDPTRLLVLAVLLLLLGVVLVRYGWRRGKHVGDA